MTEEQEPSTGEPRAKLRDGEITPAQRAGYEALRTLSHEAAKHKRPGATSDHSDMYDENGLPI